MAITTWINGKINDYVAVNGIIQQNNELLTEAYSRIITPYGSYIFDTTFGSFLTIWINTRRLLTVDEISTEISRCLQIIITQKRATSIIIQVPQISKGAVFFNVSITDNSNQTFTLKSNYIAI